MKTVLVWGRYGNYGPDYPRNRVIESVMRELGCEVVRFLPSLSALADIEFSLRRLAAPDVIWVPCFRQRDLPAAVRYGRRHGIQVVFDPLISAYDKQVNERRKFSPDSLRGQRLLAQERRLFQSADMVVADTRGHADYYHEVLGVPEDRLFVIPVGAEESLFRPHDLPLRPDHEPLELVFFGTFIGLQGVDVLAAAIRQYDGPPVHWRLIGDGPMRPQCEQALHGLAQVTFEPWGPLQELPARLVTADTILGIFGITDKARRVIPNKVYQGLALGRPVITARTPAYPEAVLTDEGAGMFWAEPGSPESIVAAVKRVHQRRAELPDMARMARRTYENHFSNRVIADVLRTVLHI